jgi:hypothetical protein
MLSRILPPGHVVVLDHVDQVCRLLTCTSTTLPRRRAFAGLEVAAQVRVRLVFLLAGLLHDDHDRLLIFSFLPLLISTQT